MKIAYIHNIKFKKNIVGTSVILGFEKACKRKMFDFVFFDIVKISSLSFKDVLKKLIAYCPDIIFTSTNYLQYIPLNKLKNAKSYI